MNLIRNLMKYKQKIALIFRIDTKVNIILNIILIKTIELIKVIDDYFINIFQKKIKKILHKLEIL